MPNEVGLVFDQVMAERAETTFDKRLVIRSEGWAELPFHGQIGPDPSQHLAAVILTVVGLDLPRDPPSDEGPADQRRDAD